MFLFKTHKKWRRQDLNNKVTGHRSLTKHNLHQFQRNEQTVIVRDELMAFTALVNFRSQGLQNKRHRMKDSEGTAVNVYS